MIGIKSQRLSGGRTTVYPHVGMFPDRVPVRFMGPEQVIELLPPERPYARYGRAERIRDVAGGVDHHVAAKCECLADRSGSLPPHRVLAAADEGGARGHAKLD